MKQVINKDQLGKDLKSILEAYEVKINAETGKEIVGDFFDKIAEYLINGDDINVHGFGKIENKVRAARKGRNPQSGEEIEIAAKRALGFRPLGELKKRLNS